MLALVMAPANEKALPLDAYWIDQLLIATVEVLALNNSTKSHW